MASSFCLAGYNTIRVPNSRNISKRVGGNKACAYPSPQINHLRNMKGMSRAPDDLERSEDAGTGSRLARKSEKPTERHRQRDYEGGDWDPEGLKLIRRA